MPHPVIQAEMEVGYFVSKRNLGRKTIIVASKNGIVQNSGRGFSQDLRTLLHSVTTSRY